VTLEQLRQRIDELDEDLVRLLNERAACALRIGEIKTAMGLPMYQPEREADVLRHVRAASVAGGGPLGPEAIARLFERVIDEARGLELKAARTPERK
jgi:chorismate mutase-like protein